MTRSYQPTLRDRLVAKHRSARKDDATFQVPAAGPIPDDLITAIDLLARRAREGEMAARDRLYTALAPRLHRKGYILRPWPNTPQHIGIWDRDDVDQEGWIVYAELLAAWDGEMPFVPYLFARFPWRLRDRVLRGIGRPLPWVGGVRVPEVLLADVLSAHDSDQPESALLANKLLEHLLQNMFGSTIPAPDPDAMLAILMSPRGRALPETTSVPDDDHPFSQIEAA